MIPAGQPPLPPNDLHDRAALRAAMRRDILRANTAVAVVLIAVLALALVAVFAGLRAARNQSRAQAAEADAQERLRLAYTAEARAIRVSAEAGGRAAAMIAISNAVAIHNSPESRTEAIACLALTDLVQEGPLVPAPKDMQLVLMDSQLHYFAYGDARGKVLAYNLADGRPAFDLEATNYGARTQRPISDLVFSPDGFYLAARFQGGAVVVWEVATRMPVYASNVQATNMETTQHFSELAFSADSKQLIFGDLEQQGGISICEVATGRKITSNIGVLDKTFRMRPDLKQVAVASDTSVELLDFPGGNKQARLTHSANVEMIDWSPDGRRLAVTSAAGDVDLWEPENDVHWQLAGHSERCIRLKFSSDGKLLFSSSRDGTTRLWDVMMGRMVAVGEGLGGNFTPDGRRIGFWKPWQGFGVWKVSPSSLYTIHECDKSQGPLLSIDLSPSGRWCVVTQRKGFRIWDLAGNDRETYIPMAASGVRVAMDESCLYVCRDTGLETWPLVTNTAGELEFSPAQVKKISLPDNQGSRAVSLSRDGHWAVVELLDRSLVKIDLTGGQAPLPIKGRWGGINFKGAGSPTGVGRFNVSPDGRWVVTGFSFNGSGPIVWDGNTGEQVAILPADTSLAGFSPDGHWLALAGMNSYSIWSVGDWKLQREVARDETSLVHGTLAFMPNGTQLAVSRTRQTVQLRDWKSDEIIGDFIAPVPQSINSVRLSADGATLVMATASDMVEVWRLGELHRELGAMKLDWEDSQNGKTPPAVTAGPASGSWQFSAIASLGGFFLVATIALLTLRRHRSAIERFVVAEAHVAQSHRELDLARVELMHSQKMQALGTLAAGIAHDFNNLLSVIRMSNKLIGRQAQCDPEIQELVTDVEQAVLQGKSVVGSVLGYARSGKETGDPTDLSALIEETVSLLSREFLSGLALTLELERQAPRVNVARGPMEQVLLNLLVNAAEAMHGRGSLKISLQTKNSPPARAYVLRPRAGPHYLELAVVDSGPGIPPQFLDRLFEPFFTTKHSGSKVGTGLGLSLVYSIAQQAGLGLSVESEYGRGARFLVLIPVAPGPVRETHSVKMNGPA